MIGRVLKSTGSWFELLEESGQRYSARLRGQLRIRDFDSTNPLAVGDLVQFELETDGRGVIFDRLDRKNHIVRKSVNLSRKTQVLAANIDRAWLIITPEFPRTSTGFIDRFLCAAASFHIPAALILSKAVLFTGELSGLPDEYRSIYEPLNYPFFEVSAFKKSGLDELRKELSGQINLFAGHSGVGKSSLINALEPGLELKTGVISLQHLKGKHTTTFAEMFALSSGGFIIDTPGIKEFVNIDFQKTEVSHYFVEMLPLLNSCHFNNCLHLNEKDCAVLDALEKGLIHPSRYHNYRSILRGEDIYR